ncbi:hypothetical protein [Peribacillus frigoritolerans]|uniref:hypothetical protein n=1 Tax=Peribacillus frigoritolerans TaxID=450367 RepID=UPI003F7D7576
MGIPIALLHGDMADVEKPTRNYMTFCIDPFLKKIRDELNAKMIDKKEFLAGKKVETKRASYSNMFDVATAVDKYKYFIIKNYQESSEAIKGGEKNEA